MNATRLAVGILFVVFASKMCLRVMAQDAEQPFKADLHQADSLEHRVFLTAEGEDANRVRPDDRLRRSRTVPVSGRMAPVPDRQRSTAPSTTTPEDDCLDGCCCPSCDERCCPTCDDPCPSVYGQVEALFLKREPRFIRQPIIVDPNSSTTFLSTSDLDFDFDPGLRATVGMRLCGGRALEFSYFALFEENASAVAVSPDPGAFLIFPDNLAGNVFVDIDRAEVDYSSRLHSFEVNLPCCCGCCDDCCHECGCGEVHDGCGCNEYGCGEVRCRSLEWFAGFRYLNVGEELNISAQRIVAGGVEEGTYDIRTANRLYGGQLGARLRRTRGRFGWEATGKAGIFGNDAREEQAVTDFPNFPLRPTVSDSSGGVAFVGEANLSALYRLTDAWNLRAGYTVLWIDGLALAPDQLDFDFAASPSGNQLHNDGAMFLHGVNVGLEARW